METKIKNEVKNNWRKRTEFLTQRMKDYHSLLLKEVNYQLNGRFSEENYKYWAYHWFRKMKICYNLLMNIYEMHGITLLTKDIEIILRE